MIHVVVLGKPALSRITVDKAASVATSPMASPIKRYAQPPVNCVQVSCRLFYINEDNQPTFPVVNPTAIRKLQKARLEPQLDLIALVFLESARNLRARFFVH